MADPEHLALRQEMTIARHEFLRTLPAAISHLPFEVRGDEIRSLDPAHAFRIVLAPLPDLVIANLALVRHRVEIHLRGYDAAAERAFLARFELHYRRGGG